MSFTNLHVQCYVRISMSDRSLTDLSSVFKTTDNVQRDTSRTPSPSPEPSRSRLPFLGTSQSKRSIPRSAWAEPGNCRWLQMAPVVQNPCWDCNRLWYPPAFRFCLGAESFHLFLWLGFVHSSHFSFTLKYQTSKNVRLTHRRSWVKKEEDQCTNVQTSPWLQVLHHRIWETVIGF